MKWFHRLKERQQRYREVFEATENGKWVLADLAHACGFGQDPHTKGDPHTTAYLVGRQFPILHIRSVLDMSHAEMAVIVKQQEEIERRKDEGIFGNE